MNRIVVDLNVRCLVMIQLLLLMDKDLEDNEYEFGDLSV